MASYNTGDFSLTLTVAPGRAILPSHASLSLGVGGTQAPSTGLSLEEHTASSFPVIPEGDVWDPVWGDQAPLLVPTQPHVPVLLHGRLGNTEGHVGL